MRCWGGHRTEHRFRVPDHPRVTLIEDSSVAPDVVDRVRRAASGKRVMSTWTPITRQRTSWAICQLLADIVSPGWYLIVEDTSIGPPLCKHLLPGPAEALEEWLAKDQPFDVDPSREKFLLGRPGGYLRRRDQP